MRLSRTGGYQFFTGVVVSRVDNELNCHQRWKLEVLITFSSSDNGDGRLTCHHMIFVGVYMNIAVIELLTIKVVSLKSICHCSPLVVTNMVAYANVIKVDKGPQTFNPCKFETDEPDWLNNFARSIASQNSRAVAKTFASSSAMILSHTRAIFLFLISRRRHRSNGDDKVKRYRNKMKISSDLELAKL
jgi:hypothetical protein